MRLPRMKMLLLCFAPALLAAHVPRAEAAVIVGGSGLLDAASANQLEAWLGEGTIEITRIYAKASGDTSADFHSAVDGQGRTFSLIEVLESQNNLAYFPNTGETTVDIQRQIIGGYNPQSWRTGFSYNRTLNDIDRTAFLFNLTLTEIQRQNLMVFDYGEYQTFNDSGYGPTFGGGHDIWVNGELSSGYVNNLSYGGTTLVDNIVIDGGRTTYDLQYGQIEVFTIHNVNAAVPEPASLLAWCGFGLVGMALRGTRRRMR